MKSLSTNRTQPCSDPSLGRFSVTPFVSLSASVCSLCPGCPSQSEALPGSGRSVGEEGPPASDTSDPDPKTDPRRAGPRAPGEERERRGAGPLGGSRKGSQEVTASGDGGEDRAESRKEEKEHHPLVEVTRLEQQVGLMNLFLFPFFPSCIGVLHKQRGRGNASEKKQESSVSRRVEQNYFCIIITKSNGFIGCCSFPL